MLPILELSNIRLSYHSTDGETLAIDDLSLEVYKGEFIAIVGPSGCGKSTLLSIISGLLSPSDGTLINNSNSNVGYMLQKDHLFNWRTIKSNACLGLELQNKLTKENIEYVDFLLEQYGLGDFKYKYPKQLSGGMRQRVALIRTLAVKPELLLLDEPFSALDYQTRLFVSDEIGTIIKNEKKTAILVTHDISEAISMADKIVVLTKRPATVKSVHDINFDMEDRTPMKTRDAKEFKDYFNLIWKELDVHVQ